MTVLPTNLISGIKSQREVRIVHLGVFDLAQSPTFAVRFLFEGIICSTGTRRLSRPFQRAKVILKLPVLIGFNESMTFQGNPTISGTADLNRIHIKEALGCNSERGSPQEDEELIIL